MDGIWRQLGRQQFQALALASNKTFLKARQNVYGMFIGTDVYSSLTSCRIAKKGDQMWPFSFIQSKGKRWEF